MNNWLRRAVQNGFHKVGIEIRRVHGSGIMRDRTSTHAFSHTFQRLSALRDLGFSPTSICDIGASDGRWSRKCLGVFPKAQYFCVDPLDEHQPHLAQFSAEYPNVSYWQGCLGSGTGHVIMNVDGAGSSILPGHAGNPYGIQREVIIETLDNLVQKGICPRPDLIKLDVQGYELEVLKGAVRTLNETQAIIAEVSFFSFQRGMPVFHEVVGEMAGHGFMVFDVLSLSLRPLDGAAGQANLLFLRETHPLRSSNKWDHDSIY